VLVVFARLRARETASIFSESLNLSTDHGLFRVRDIGGRGDDSSRCKRAVYSTVIAKTPLVLGIENVGYIIDENGQRMLKAGAVYAIQKALCYL
jgi:hypothetical protein